MRSQWNRGEAVDRRGEERAEVRLKKAAEARKEPESRRLCCRAGLPGNLNLRTGTPRVAEMLTLARHRPAGVAALRCELSPLRRGAVVVSNATDDRAIWENK